MNDTPYREEVLGGCPLATVGELRKAIADVPDDIPLEGEYGEDLVRLELVSAIVEDGSLRGPEPRRYVRVSY